MIDAKLLNSMFPKETEGLSAFILELFDRGLRDDIIVALINKALREAKDKSQLKVEEPRIEHKCRVMGMELESWPHMQKSSITVTPFTDICINVISAAMKDRDMVSIEEVNELMRIVVDVYKLENIWSAIDPLGGMEIYIKVLHESGKLKGNPDDATLAWYDPKNPPRVEEIEEKTDDLF